MRIAIVDNRGRPIRVMTDDSSVYEVDPSQWDEWQHNPARVVLPPDPSIGPPPRLSVVAAPEPVVIRVEDPEAKRTEQRRREALRRLRPPDPKPFDASASHVRMFVDGLRSRPVL